MSAVRGLIADQSCRSRLPVAGGWTKGVTVDVNTVVSAVAAVIALAALGFTIQQTRLSRVHNRLSVQPVLDFGESYRPGDRAGLRLRNVGLGPARIVSGEVWLNGRRREEAFGKPVIDAVRDELGTAHRRPSAATFTPGAVLASDYDAFVLSVTPYDPDIDNAFVDLLGRLRIVIVYASLYGDENVVEWSGGR